MFRPLIVFAGFAAFTPAIRGFLFDAYKTVDQVIQTHTMAAYIATGVLGFASFLAVKLTSRH